MGYGNFKYDFIKRTLDIIEAYEADKGPYDVTSLINNCLGLLILPKELLQEKIPLDILKNTEKTFGISKKNIEFILEEKDTEQFDNYDKYNIRNVVTHLRNALSHGRISQVLSGGNIDSLIFEDWNKRNEQTFKANMSIEEFRTFAILSAKEVLKSEPKEEK